MRYEPDGPLLPIGPGMPVLPCGPGGPTNTPSFIICITSDINSERSGGCSSGNPQ